MTGAAGGLMGRDRELKVLRDRWVRAGGKRGGAVLVIGEAGVGKSRLVHHVMDEACAGGATVVEAHCVAIGGEPLRHAAGEGPARRTGRHGPDDPKGPLEPNVAGSTGMARPQPMSTVP
jgi:hypothetical protein